MPKELRKPYHQDNGGPTIGLLLRLTKTLHGTGKIIVLDSGFCVLKAIVELQNVGFFAAALTKKKFNWPKHIKCDDIEKHFEENEVGTVDSLGVSWILFLSYLRNE